MTWLADMNDVRMGSQGVDMEEIFDVCIIGSGPGGYACAVRCYDFGNRVCLIEGAHVGGAGIMNGAMTSKAMWDISRKYAEALSPESVFRVSSMHLAYSDLRDNIMRRAKERQYQLLSQLETFSVKKEGKGSIEFIRGTASFLDNKSVEVSSKKGEKTVVFAKKFVIATGTVPRQLHGLPFDGKQILSSDHILELEDFPKRLMVIGAGIIGCEHCTIFANFKKTEVHLLDRSQRVIPFEDDDVSQFVHNNLQKIGVTIHSKTSLREIRRFDNYIEVLLDHQDGHIEMVEVDAVLVSVGRSPNTESLKLERVGIEPKSFHDTLEVDGNCCVKDNIYAVGDISGHTALYNVAEMEGRHCAKVINASKECKKIDYGRLTPTIMFFSPEVATVGYNEKKCQELKIPYKVASFSFKLLTRGIAMNNSNGFVKVITSYEDDPYILGMRLAGLQASSSVMFGGPLIDAKMPISKVLNNVHPHPSMTEGIQGALRALMGSSIMKPVAFPDQIKVYSWKPEEK